MLSPENKVRGSRDVPSKGKGFQSALLDRNTEGSSVPLRKCFHLKAGGHHKIRVAAEAIRGGDMASNRPHDTARRAPGVA
jgi:hypothetical protein